MYERILSYVNSTYWALERAKFEAMVSVLRMRSAGLTMTPEEIQERIEALGGKAAGPLERFWCAESDAWLAADARVPGRQTVAVIGVYGMLAHRAGSLEEMSGGTSTERLAASIRQATNDASVKGIVLDVNSPGGSVDGVTEVAAAIREARAVKPVEAVVNAHAHSGGYWIASAAQYVTSIPSGLMGSIGVFSAHLDESKAMEMRGEALEIIADDTLSKYKAEDAVGPLSPEARDHRRSIANNYADYFGKDVARGRGVSVDTVRRDFGQGRSLPAKAALAAKMIDGIGSLDDAIRRVARGSTPAREASRAEGGIVHDQTAVLHASEPIVPVEPQVAWVRDHSATPTPEQIAAAEEMKTL